MHVIDLLPSPPRSPCPKDSICVDATAARFVGWKTVFMLDLDGDGEPDLAFRRRDTCGPKGQLAAGELRVRDGREWRIAFRNLQERTWVMENARDVSGDDTFPPKP